MPLQVHDPETGIAFQIDLPDDRRVALSRQLARSQLGGYRDGFRECIATALVEAMNARLDWDLLPPTEPQKSFAVSISEGLGIDIPREALRFRGAMSEFLTAYADRLKALQTLRASVKTVQFTSADLKLVDNGSVAPPSGSSD